MVTAAQTGAWVYAFYGHKLFSIVFYTEQCVKEGVRSNDAVLMFYDRQELINDVYLYSGN